MRPTPDRSASSSWLSSRIAGSHEIAEDFAADVGPTGEKRRTDLKVARAPAAPWRRAATANVLALQIPYWLPVNFNGSQQAANALIFIQTPSSLFGNHEQGQGSLRHRDPTHLGGGDNTREHIICRPRVCREQIRANSRQLLAAGCYRRSADSLEHRHGGQRLPGPDGSARTSRPGYVAVFAAAEEKAASSRGSGRGLRPRREWPRRPRYGPHQCRRPSAATCVGFHGMVQTFQSKTIGDQGSHSIQQRSAIYFDARRQNVIEIRC